MGRLVLRCAGVLAVAGAPALATPPQYELTVVSGLDLPLAGPAGQPLAVNVNGRVVGYSYDGGTNYRALSWKEGVPLGLSGPEQYQRTFGNGINSFGRTVGGGYLLDGDGAVLETHAFKWVGANRTDLGTLGGHHAAALGINDSEQIVGYSTTAGDGLTRAFVYQSGAMSALPAPAGAIETYAYDISNTGFIAGTGIIGNNPAMPLLWRNGQVTQLPIGRTARTGAVNAVNNYGVAVGTYELNQYTGAFAAAVWVRGEVYNLGSLGGSVRYAVAKDINNFGQIVGTSLSPDGLAGFVWQNGRMYDLNALALLGPDVRIIGAAGINDHGQIAAAALIDGRQTAVLLTPIVAGVPAPGSLSLLALAGLVAARRRR